MLSFRPHVRCPSLSAYLAFHFLTQKSSSSGLWQTSTASSSLAVQGASSVPRFPFSVSLSSFKEDAAETQMLWDVLRTAQGLGEQCQQSVYNQRSHF